MNICCWKRWGLIGWKHVDVSSCEGFKMQQQCWWDGVSQLTNARPPKANVKWVTNLCKVRNLWSEKFMSCIIMTSFGWSRSCWVWQIIALEWSYFTSFELLICCCCQYKCDILGIDSYRLSVMYSFWETLLVLININPLSSTSILHPDWIRSPSA